MIKLSDHTPIVNLNGNEGASLVHDVRLVLDALEATMAAMRASDLTHGRNFQTNPAGDHDAFCGAWQTHLAALEAMSEDIVDAGLNLLDQ